MQNDKNGWIGCREVVGGFVTGVGEGCSCVEDIDNGVEG